MHDGESVVLATAGVSRDLRIAGAVAYLAPLVRPHTSLGLVLGSGYGDVISALTETVTAPYLEIPGFPRSTVPGHRGRVVTGYLGGRPVVVLEGRVHAYEGYEQSDVTFPIRVLDALGVNTLVLTNAAGGLNRSFHVGDLMLITDHLNLVSLAGLNPLRGPLHHDPMTPFVPMKDAYDPALRAKAVALSDSLGMRLQQGVYAMVGGPSYETPAEVHFLRAMGADAVGMSTTSEVIVARQLGMAILAVSCISNLAAGLDTEDVHHADVLAVVGAQVPRFIRLLLTMIENGAVERQPS